MADNGGNGNVDRYARSTAWFIERIGFERSLILILVAGVGYLLIWQQPKNDAENRKQYADSVADVSKKHDEAMKEFQEREDKEMPNVISKTVTDTITTLKGEGIVFLTPGKSSPLAELKEESLKAQANYWKRQADHYRRESAKLTKLVPKNAAVAMAPYGVDAPIVHPESAHVNERHNDRLPPYENLPGNETGMGRPPSVGPPTVGAVVNGVAGAIR